MIATDSLSHLGLGKTRSDAGIAEIVSHRRHYAPCTLHASSTYAHAALHHPTSGRENAGMDATTQLGPAIAAIRARKGMSQTALADAIGGGLGQPGISRVERNEQGLSLESLAAVAAALRVPISEIWQEAERRVSGLPAVAEPSATYAVDEASRVPNDIDALRYAMGALFTVVATTRPAEGEAVAKVLREVAPTKFLDKKGSIHELLKALESGARLARERKAARRGAAPESP